MEHPSHKHSLILNENYIAKEGDVCCGCNKQIFSFTSFVYCCSGISCSTGANTRNIDGYPNIDLFPDISVFFAVLRCTWLGLSCDKFLLHKSCAELPPCIQNPTNPKDFLNLCLKHSYIDLLRYITKSLPPYRCNICGIPLLWNAKQFFYYSSYTHLRICLKCAMFQVESSENIKLIKHAAHSQHPLALIQRPSSFKCDACDRECNVRDASYKCTKCAFWMHKSCADAPTSFLFEFHNKHPLILSYFLPQVYHKFIQYCSLCHKTLSRLDWLYYCPRCRLLAHFQCARSSRRLSSSENEKCDSDLVHLPTADESSANLLREQFVKAVSTLNSTSTIYSNTNCIRHWAHDEHLLQLINTNELIDRKDDDDEIVLLCDDCVKPIRTDSDLFYGCVLCKYYVHKVCAEFPRTMENHILGGEVFSIRKCEQVYELFVCDGCRVSCNGTFFRRHNLYLHIGCATLPKILKHEAHRHQLTQVYRVDCVCRACGEKYGILWKHGCDECDFYICEGCIMKPRTAKHPWDPHTLHLIYEPGMVMDHEHHFNCEYCSKDIDPNRWFYHCEDCDLSLHLKNCFERSRYGNYSNVKFGATDIYIHKLHPHPLTFVLNKKVRSCKKCNRKQLGEPVLECAPCKAIFCRWCCLD